MNDEHSYVREIEAALADCQQQVDQLKRENRLLREAAGTFGALAERLNASLELERRRKEDRRTHPRQSTERRRLDVAADGRRS